MYRIVFKPAIAAWVVQLQTLGILWSSVKDGKKVRTFDNYENALKYVYSVGLDQVYRDAAQVPGWFTTPSQPTYQGGYQPAAAPQPYIVNAPRVV